MSDEYERAAAPAAENSEVAAESRPDDREHDALRRDAEELQRALTHLVRVYQFRDRKRICCHDVSVTQCYALDELARSDTASVRSLATALYLDNSTTSRVIDSLERKGLAERAPDPEDGRAVRVKITTAGRILYDRIARDLVEQSQRLLADFDPEVRQATTRLIARLAREAASRFSRADGRCC